MTSTSRRIISLLVVAAASLGASNRTDRDAHAAEGCKLEYQRADNMWAAAGRPDGNLGVETIAFAGPNQSQSFNTDWRYEKLRNDGRNFYGSHLRIAKNAGARQVVLKLVTATKHYEDVSLQPGQSQQFQHDLRAVLCR